MSSSNRSAAESFLFNQPSPSHMAAWQSEVQLSGSVSQARMAGLITSMVDAGCHPDLQPRSWTRRVRRSVTSSTCLATSTQR